MGRAKRRAGNKANDAALETLRAFCDVLSAQDHRDIIDQPVKQFVKYLESEDIFDADMNDNSGERILDVERSTCHVQTACRAYLDRVRTDRAELIDLFRDLNAFKTESNLLSTGVLTWCRSLVSTYSAQVFTEQRLVTKLLQIIQNDLYADWPKQRLTAKGVCQAIFEQMNRTTLLNGIQFLELKRMVEPLDDENSLPDALLGKAVETDSIRKDNAETSVLQTTKFRQVNRGIINAMTVSAAFDAFLQQHDQQNPTITSILVVGPEGSGKTYLCDSLQSRLKPDCTVIRPILPLDILGESVGETEDLITSIFGALAPSCCEKKLIVLDGLCEMLPVELPPSISDDMTARTSNQSSHLHWRSKACLQSMIDVMERIVPIDGDLLILATSRRDVEAQVARFDRVYHLEQPNEVARTKFITSFVIPINADEEKMLADIVESTAGRSFAELSVLCREALSGIGEESKSNSLTFIKKALVTITPASLRTGIIDDFVDMRVLNSRDLLDLGDNDLNEFPLEGESAKDAWIHLKSSIVIPLCRARELETLLNHTDTKLLSGGVLITGDSGTGKTTLAVHCARYCARLVNNIKLLDVSCTSLIHKELGGSERAIHHLFDVAKRSAPCIVLLDGIENIAAVRGNDPTTEGTLDRVLSTLLVELDGVDAQDSDQLPIAVIGITLDAAWIDPALKRPGRLSNVIHLCLT